MRGRGFVKIIRVGVTDFRLTVCTHPQLQKIAERTVAVLTANESVHSAAMDKMLTRQHSRGKRWARSVPVQHLDHPKGPVAAVAGLGAGRRIRCNDWDAV